MVTEGSPQKGAELSAAAASPNKQGTAGTGDFAHAIPPPASRDTEGRALFPDGDPELERELQSWAQLLVDIHVWKDEQKREKMGRGIVIDGSAQSSTI